MLGVAGSIVVAYVWSQPRPVELTVADGSTVGSIEGDFVRHGSNDSIIRFFNATTYANESDGRASVLTLRLRTWTFFEAATGMVITDIEVKVEGEFRSNLHVGGLSLSYNQTGCPSAFAWGYAEPNPVNISYDPASHQMIYVCNGTAAFTPTLENQTGQGAVYMFVFPALVEDKNPLGYNQSVAFRATVSGDFRPDVSVGILLRIIDVPGGV